MANFSNGTEGEVYQEKYCCSCLHWKREEKGCPVWVAHLIYNGDGPMENILNILIPMNGVFPGECTMYVRDEAKDPFTGELFKG